MTIFDKIKEKFGGNIIKIREAIEDDFIVWKDDYELQESDFQGKPFGPLFGYDAITASKKLIDADIKITSINSDEIHYKIIKFKVTAIMSKSESWIDPASKKHKDVNLTLHHEQRHFMIEEAFAKKLRKKLEERIKNEFTCTRVDSEDPRITVERNVRVLLNTMLEKCKEITDAYQTEYDKNAFDERGNENPQGQKEYDAKIAKMLQDS